MAARPIDFYFDFSSPYSYIASEWIEALAARHGRTVSWRAILLGATFQHTELRSPVDYPVKREYTMLDFERSARFAGVPLKIPAKFPIPTQNAARLFWWLQQRGDLTASHWARHCLRAFFARGVDLSDPAALASMRDGLAVLLAAATRATLLRLYPEAAAAFDAIPDGEARESAQPPGQPPR